MKRGALALARVASLPRVGLATASLLVCACGSGGGTPNMSAAGSSMGGSTSNGGTASGGNPATGGSFTGTLPEGALYTDGAQIKRADGKGSGAPWVGRGLNMDDLFFCGYNGTMWMPDAPGTLKQVVESVVSGWKPSFVRLSLSMASDPKTVSWTGDVDTYQKPMIDVVHALTGHGVYVLVVLRSDLSMVGQDMQHGDPEATGIPSDATTTPDKTKFPNGTDPVYEALVQSFKDDSHVLFGLTNEPGGNLLMDERIKSALDHAVGTIRAAEDRLKTFHHLVSVQGQGWTSDIGMYAKAPLTHDNVVYEVHGYPPTTDSYTHANIPVIIGEYGSLDAGSAPAFFKDIDAKNIPSLAWDLDSFSNCAPDLVEVNQSPTDLKPTDWGKLVQAYLLGHAG